MFFVPDGCRHCNAPVALMAGLCEQCTREEMHITVETDERWTCRHCNAVNPTSGPEPVRCVRCRRAN